ncbi:type II and III secretion system protein [Marinifilum fragile]|uniref:type II secretion system protein GspD n=1 Tax=Marinifilum fragile TaxID=570161 RepID=UPI002AAAADB0|nr:type II and III secretion system protein [Marinifilum fragile]
MKKQLLFCLLFIGVLCLCTTSKAQKYTHNIHQVLDSISIQQIPELNSEVNISVNKVNVAELLRALANDVGLNLSVPVNTNVLVSNNFSGVKAKDVILFLCEEYGFDLSIFGKILKLELPPEIPQEPEPLKISYQKESKTIGFDLHRAVLSEVSKEITKQTGNNIILSPGLESQQINCFVQDLPVKQALEQLAWSNKLEVKQAEENLFLLEPSLKQARGQYSGRQSNLNLHLSNGTSVEVLNEKEISIDVDNYSLEQLFLYVAQQLDEKYVIYNPIKGMVSLHVKNISWEEFLYQAFKSTQSIYKFQDDFCFVGDRKTMSLKTTELLSLQYRSVDKLKEVFPAAEIKDLDIKELAELNSFVVMGDADRIFEFKKFIKQIDKTVPVVLIDVIILEVSDTKSVETGIEAGLTDKKVETSGTVLSGVDMTLSSKSVNNLISDLGLTKLGKVSSNFYLKLKAMESEGVVDIRSTPRLSTLNGHEATLVIGETEYYKEERNDYLGTQNPSLSSQTMYKPVDAELKVVIKPFVAGDGNITMDIDVSQSDFTERISEFAPPGKVSRQFKSMIRIGNQETILLGGLEEKRKTHTSRGVPFLAKIPIIKWFFSSRKKEDVKSKLNILIKPTIIG